MSEAENPTTEREAEKPAADKPSTDTGHHLSARATSALGAAGGPTKKCASCGRRQPAKRTRCTACGANLPEKTEDEEAADAAKAPEAASPGPATAVAAPATEGAEAKAADDKRADEKPVEAKADEKKAEEPASVEAAKPEPAKVDEKKPEPVKAEDEKPAAKPAEPEPAPSAPAASGEEVTLEALLARAAGHEAPAAEPAKSDEKRAEDKKPEPSRSDEKRADEKRADEKRADEKRADEKRADEKRADEKRAEEKKPEPAADRPKAAPATSSGTMAAPARKAPAPTPAPRPVAPPVNVGATVKAEIAPLQKAVDHVGDQIKAGLTLVAKGQRTLEEKVTITARALEEIAKESQRRRKDYDALYEEMRQYKTNFLDTAQKPLFNELLLLFDSVQRIMRRVDEIPDAAIPKEAVTEAFKQVKDELLEILYRRDIEMIEEHPRKLDVKLQKPLRRVETENTAEDKDVVEYVREGFRRNGILFRPQEVVVKRCLAVASDEQPIDGGDKNTEKTPAGDGASPAPETPKKEES